MNSIKRIQNVQNTNQPTDINIYDNYVKKLQRRYSSYDYSRFNNHKEIYEYLINELTVYENGNHGKCVVIHGDAVMTNIMINSMDKIKFIDMRGKVGDNVTIYGDFLYDWSKLYQSLLGYDKILLNKTMNFSY
jgi:aminoglycoside phosphotransferase